ncbi:peflin [Purpureocillium lilacinum]|uniref:Peflin n=2 Tax=Purpureocillium lilacinum TaxID=33203 RepID=A0A2U3EI32_PURLI|nr:peflin [Purpureocillium lilacinum]
MATDKPDPRAPSLLPPSPERPPRHSPAGLAQLKRPAGAPQGHPGQSSSGGMGPDRCGWPCSANAPTRGRNKPPSVLPAPQRASACRASLPPPPITQLLRAADYEAADAHRPTAEPITTTPCEQQTTLPAPPIRTLPPPTADHVHFDVCLPPSLSLSTTPSPDAKDKGHETADGFPRRRSGLTARRPSRWRTTDPTTRTLSPDSRSPSPRDAAVWRPPSMIADRRAQQKPGAAPPPSASYAQQPSSSRYDSKPPPPAPRDQYKQPPYGHASPPPPPQQQHHQQQPPHSQGPPPRTTPPPAAAAAAAAGSAAAIASPGLPPAAFACPRRGLRLRLDAAAALPCRTGQLSEKELSAALVNGDWTAFDIQTVRMMIRMFDSDRNGTINFEEFCGLWSFLASWRTLFDRFDVDRSGNISLSEFTDALIAFRYRLSPAFVELLFRTYDKRGEGVMSFDLFVQSCISLKRMTDVFKKYDDDRDGFITLSFEDFLSEILKQLK